MREDRRSFSQTDEPPVYQCATCKDQGSLLFRRNEITDERILETEFVAKFNAGEMREDSENNFRRWLQTTVECECQIRAREQRRLERVLSSSRLSPRFLKRTFDRFVWLDPDDWTDPKDQKAVADLVTSQRLAYETMLDYVENWSDYAMSGKGVGLYGDPGTAKTHLLAAKTIKLLDAGIRSVFVNTSELFAEIRACYESDETGRISRQTRPSEIIDLVKNAQDLSLDDVGTERPKETVLEIFYNILNHRYEYELPTSFTTNMSDIELQAHLVPKTHRRLTEPAAGRCRLIKGPSFERILMKLPAEKRRRYQS